MQDLKTSAMLSLTLLSVSRATIIENYEVGGVRNVSDHVILCLI